MKILLVNLPYEGHVMPTIGLVQELIKLGCEVTYMLPFEWEEKISGSGAAFLGYKNHRQLSEQMKYAYAAATQIVEDYDLIIYEQFFFLGKHLAENHHKPAVRIFTAPATNEELMKEYITAKGPLSIFRHKWVAKAFTKDIVKHIPEQVSLKTDDWLDEIIHNPPELNFVYTLREYQPFEEEFPKEHYKFLGPSIYERKAQPLEYVKKEKPLVYISLGTVLKGAVSFFQSCVDAFRDADVDVIISVGNRFDVRKLKNVPEHIRIYKYVPQIQVLKMADVFVTHGGMNSVSEAMTFSVPMVVIPFVSDQPVNARCIERLGIGKSLGVSKVNSEVLNKVVFEVVLDESMKKNYEMLQKRICDAPGNKGGAEAVVQYYKKYKADV